MRRWRRFPFITAYLFLILVVADFLVVLNQSGHVLAGDRPADEQSYPFLNTGIVIRDPVMSTIYLMGAFAVLGVIEVYTVRRWHRTRSVAGTGKAQPELGIQK